MQSQKAQITRLQFKQHQLNTSFLFLNLLQINDPYTIITLLCELSYFFSSNIQCRKQAELFGRFYQHICEQCYKMRLFCLFSDCSQKQNKDFCILFGACSPPLLQTFTLKIIINDYSLLNFDNQTKVMLKNVRKELLELYGLQIPKEVFQLQE